MTAKVILTTQITSWGRSLLLLIMCLSVSDGRQRGKKVWTYGELSEETNCGEDDFLGRELR